MCNIMEQKCQLTMVIIGTTTNIGLARLWLALASFALSMISVKFFKCFHVCYFK